MELSIVKKKRKWETIVKHCMKKLEDDSRAETWLSIRNRRLSAFPNSKVVLPTEAEGEGLEDKRPTVYFFLDTSGSCTSYAERFWRLLSSVPTNLFDMRLFCFDTQVYPISLQKRKLYGFGGTSFNILENRIRSDIANAKYPDGVFVITDGYGNRVTPLKPKKWHVLLVSQSSKHCFPKEVNFYNMSDFE